MVPESIVDTLFGRRGFVRGVAVATGLACVVISTLRVSAAEVVVSTPTGAAIQAALDAAAGNPAIDTVRLVPGASYAIDQPLRVHSGLTLTGPSDPGLALPILNDTSNNNGGAIIDLTDQSGVTVANLLLDGRGGRADTGVAAWGETTTSSNLTITGLTIQNIANTLPTADPNQFGIFFSANVTDSTIADNTILNIRPDSPWSAGIRIANGSSRNVVEHNLVRRVGRGGILANDLSTDLVIRRNTVQLSSQASDGLSIGLSIELFNGVDRSVVERNTVDRWISVDGSDFVAVRSNDVQIPADDQAFAGLEFVDSEFFVASHNRVTGPAQLGISVSADLPTQHGLFLDNQISDVEGYGIELFSGAAPIVNLLFHGNLVTETIPSSIDSADGSAVHALNDVDHITFDRNTLTNNAGNAVSGNVPASDYLVFLDNTITGNGNDVLPPQVATQQPPGPTYTDPNAGEDLTLAFAGIGVPVLVLWDVGTGVPVISNSATLPVPYWETGTYFAAVAWDAQGRSAFAEVRQQVLPEPSIGLGVALGLLGLRRRLNKA